VVRSGDRDYARYMRRPWRKARAGPNAGSRASCFLERGSDVSRETESHGGGQRNDDSGLRRDPTEAMVGGVGDAEISGRVQRDEDVDDLREIDAKAPPARRLRLQIRFFWLTHRALECYAKFDRSWYGGLCLYARP
jgi:hypothetical protein